MRITKLLAVLAAFLLLVAGCGSDTSDDNADGEDAVEVVVSNPDTDATGSSDEPAPEPADPEPAEEEPPTSEPVVEEPTVPEPIDPAPTAPEPVEEEPTAEEQVDDEPPAPEPTVPEPADEEEPIDDEPTDPGLPTGPLGGGTLATVTIVVTHPDAATVEYTISCLGDTATIISDTGVGLSEFAGCAQLGDPTVRDRLLNGPDLDRACTEIYGGPDVATIVGTYDGVDGPAVNTTIDRSNGCGIFEWESLLSAILPAPLGLGS